MNEKVCVVIPTYNNSRTLMEVIRGVSKFIPHIIVVDDGSTDSTPRLLTECELPITVLTMERNRGKGCALCSGFREARKQGFSYAITIDSDGQHLPTDLPAFLAAINRYPGYIIVGNRFDPSLFTQDAERNMDSESRFANKFSNFWFAIQTGKRLPDTQTGFRAYPLHHLRGLRFVTSRYEAELQLMVYAAWHGVGLHSIPIHVYYPPRDERVSHFRPGRDFARISVLNTVLCVLAAVYAWPKRLLSFTLVLSVLLLLFVVMMFVQAGLFVYFSSHKVSEDERLTYHGIIQRMSYWLMQLVPGVNTRIDNPDGEDFIRPAVVISNHQSHLDLLCIMMLTPRLVIVTKRWVWMNPLYALAIRYAEFLTITNDITKNEAQIESLIGRGYSIMIFPEGTRSASLDVLRFHQGAFSLARKFKLDIVPVVLHGTGVVLNKRARTVTPGNITIEIKPRISVDDDRCGNTPMEMAKFFRRKYREWTQMNQDSL